MSFPALRRRAVHAVRNYFHRDWTADDLFNFDEVSPFIRHHLNQFYSSLLMVSLSSAIGTCSIPPANMGSISTAFAACVSFLCFYLTAPWREYKRLCFLTLGACFGWATVTPWLSWFIGVDTGFVASITLANFMGISCFWVASRWTRSFEFVYFKAVLLCSPMLLISLLISSAEFGGDTDFWKYPLYSWLLWCTAYLAAYSQEVVLKARRGDVDHVHHAVCLYTHFPPFLIHLIKQLWEFKRHLNMQIVGRNSAAVTLML